MIDLTCNAANRLDSKALTGPVNTNTAIPAKQEGPSSLHNMYMHTVHMLIISILSCR